MITVSTDGSCLRNPGGAIGWAWVDHAGGSASGGMASGTNQIAELMAVLEAITAHPGAEPLRIESDSLYAIKCASEWVAGWRRRGWRTASGGPVQNLALVQGIERAIADRQGPVTFGWVRGHRGDRFNEEADVLAGAAARGARTTGTGTAAPEARAGTATPARGGETVRTGVPGEPGPAAERVPAAPRPLLPDVAGQVDVLF